MMHERSALLIGEIGVQTLAKASIAIIGLGGVGSFAAEALARSGVGTLYLLDADIVSTGNLNRQLVALHSTIGHLKAEVAQQRVRDISPTTTVHINTDFYTEGELFGGAAVDLVFDCIDSLNPKLRLLRRLLDAGQPFISSMGAGGKLDPQQVQIAKLSQTDICPLAARVRKFIRRTGHTLDFPVVYSREKPITPNTPLISQTAHGRDRVAQGSMIFVPATFGLSMASWGCRWLLSGGKIV